MIAENLAKYLDNLDIVDYRPNTVGGNTFINQMPDQPDLAVALFDYPGPAPDIKHPYDYPNVQVRVRGGLDPRPALALLDSIYDALHDLHRVELPGSIWLVWCRSMQSGPMPLGPDATGKRLEFTMNFNGHILNPTSNRT